MNNADMPAMPQTGSTYSDDTVVDSKDLGGAGLTKREHFAGLAMQSILSRQEISLKSMIGHEAEMFSRACVNAADALLAELEK
mgnify:CR=1 FL=1